MANRTIAPKIIDPVEFDLHLKPYEKKTLDNGIEVYAIDAGAEEVLQIEWVFFAGNWYEQQNMIAATTNFLLKNGTASKSAFQISEHFEYYGAYLNRGCYNETSTITLHCLNKHIEELLPVVQELITDATFPEDELKLYKQNNKQRLSVNLKKCDFVANRHIDEYLFGIDHPYGKYSSAEAYDAVESDQLKAFYDQFYRHGKCILFVAGKIPANLFTQLNKYFGSLPLNNKTLPEIAHPIVQSSNIGSPIRLSNDPDGVQGAVRMARPFPNRHHPDFLNVQVLNTLFGGFFGSRLMNNIREDKGYTYGIHSYLQNHIHSSAWMITTEAGKDVCDATVKEVYKEMKKLREKPVDDEELLLVKNFMMGSILGDLDGPFHIIGRWKNIILNNLDESYFYNSIGAIKSITPAEIQALANKYLQPKDFYELVVV
ncbi:pitrilysin family protein [Chitinophagaceae bacterium 26-R-25]|nr:pitrilysin family protein [Chitinophagaceae bacterium 26-R-25]